MDMFASIAADAFGCKFATLTPPSGCHFLQALACPLPLWLHTPTQAAMIAYVRRHNGEMCATAALQHPAAQQATAATYSALTALLSLLPLGASAPPRSPAGQCAAVLALAECLLGFLLPLVALVAWEAGIYHRFCQHWLSWQRAELQQMQEQPGGAMAAEAAGPSSSSAQAPHGGLLPWCPANAAGCLLPQEGPDLNLCPFLVLPSNSAAAFYRMVLACRPSELLDFVALSAAASRSAAAAWHAVLLLEPVD